MFTNYPSYASPIRGSSMSTTEKNPRDDYIVTFKEMADMLHTSDLLPVFSPEFPQIRTQGSAKAGIQLKPLLDHAMIRSSSGPSTEFVLTSLWMSTFKCSGEAG